MNTSFKLALAASLAFAAVSAVGAEMSDAERTELRERAQALQTQRVQNPVQPGGDVSLDRPRGDVRLDQHRGEVKARPKSAKKAKGSKKAKSSARKSGKPKHSRSIRDLPGALVR